MTTTHAATARAIADALDLAVPIVTVIADAGLRRQPLAEVRSHGSRPTEILLSSRATAELPAQSMRFLIAHELAHFTAPIARRRRRRRAIITLIASAAAAAMVIAFPDAHIWARSFAGALAALVVFVLIDNRLNHNEEHECDLAAAHIAGALAGLRMLEVLEHQHHQWLVDALGAHPRIHDRRARLAALDHLGHRSSSSAPRSHATRRRVANNEGADR